MDGKPLDSIPGQVIAAEPENGGQLTISVINDATRAGEAFPAKPLPRNSLIQKAELNLQTPPTNRSVAPEVRRNKDRTSRENAPREPTVEASNRKASPEADEDGLTGARVGAGRCQQTSS